MGFLGPYLRNNPQQVVTCDQLYPLTLKVFHSPDPVHLIAIHETYWTVAKKILEVVPDVDDWQYTGDVNNSYRYAFHSHKDRAKAQEHLKTLGYTIEISPKVIGKEVTT